MRDESINENEYDEDEDFRDPTPEEMWEIMLPDEDSRPGDDEPGW